MPMEEDYVSCHTGTVIDGAITAVINGRAGLQGVYLNGTELEPDGSNKVSISLGDYYDKTSIDSLLNDKVDKVTGKGLSTEDFTSDEKTKLSNIETEANKTIVVQSTGNSTTSVMSQNAVTDSLDTKFDKSSISQSTGNSTTNVMSQEATTTELNSKATVSYYTATLYSANWSNSSPYTQIINVTGILSTDKPVVDLSSPSLSNLDSWSFVSSVQSGSGTLTFQCFEDKPTVNLEINIMVVR